jgi:alcohol dehydrogenase (NADP+)
MINTVSAPVNLNAYLQLLRRTGTMGSVGAPSKPLPIAVFSLSEAGVPSPDLLPVASPRPEDARLLRRAQHRAGDRAHRRAAINDAYERVLRCDVRYRFVIDAASLRPAD